MEPTDLAIIIVAFKSAPYIENCLRTILDHAGPLRLDVVVVDVGPPDGTADIVAGFPEVRHMRCPNRGFAFANNRGLKTCDSRYALFINPDTEIVQGSLSELVARMDERPRIGLVGVRQVGEDDRLCMTIRRFPNAVRALGEALSADRLPRRPRWLGERELDLEQYNRDIECDWTTGSFMLARREAIESAGFMDERFFMYSEETDFCLRIKTAGWEVRHFPWMTILHYGANEGGGIDSRAESMTVYSRGVYAAKHFSRLHRAVYLTTLVLAQSLRYACAPGGGRRRAVHLAALKTMLRLSPPPHSPWSTFSVHPRERSAEPAPARTG